MMVRVGLHVEMVPFMVFKYNGLFSVTPTDSCKKTMVHISYTETLLFFRGFLTTYNSLKNTYLIQQIQQKATQN